MIKLTLDEMIEQEYKALTELLEYAGSKAHLSKMININLNTVNSWIRCNRISRDGALVVGEHPTLGKKFKAEYLRPDIDSYN